jgi:hypothetical protein
MNPERGRQLLERSWKSETASLRNTFIKVLEIGLSMADEPFLETALDDRDASVRRRAVELLTRLPESRLCRRMETNTEKLLIWAPRQKHKILLVFPREISAELMRDGVLRRDGKVTPQVRSNQLVEMVSAVPLDRWSRRWSASVDEIVAAVRTSRWPRTLTRGLALAVDRQRNAEWAAALLKHDEYGPNTIKLIHLLPVRQLEALMRSASASTKTLSKDSLLVKLVRKWPHPWTETMTHIWIEQLADYLKHDIDANAPESTIRFTFKPFARQCPPGLTDFVVETLLQSTNPNSVWHTPVQELISILTFRWSMLAKFKDENVQSFEFKVQGDE